MEIIQLNNGTLSGLINSLHDTVRDTPLIALCGGRSVTHATNAMLNHTSLNSTSKFKNATYITIDERLVDKTNEDSNFKLLDEAYFGKINTNKAIFFDHSIESQSIEIYSHTIDSHHEIDLCVLGVGEDGHIAGLFPNLSWDEKSAFFTFHNSPKPPKGRMTASPRTIAKSKNIILLFLGEGKKEAYARFLKNEETQQSLPCVITKSCPHLFVVTDLTI